jgi:hypothetical protein
LLGAKFIVIVSRLKALVAGAGVIVTVTGTTTDPGEQLAQEIVKLPCALFPLGSWLTLMDTLTVAEPVLPEDGLGINHPESD